MLFECTLHEIPNIRPETKCIEDAFFPSVPTLRVVESGELPDRYLGAVLIEGSLN